MATKKKTTKAAPKKKAAAKPKTKAKAKAKPKPGPQTFTGIRAWVVKSEPFVYSFDQLVKDGTTSWDGVRNFEARNAMRAMKKDDTLLYYHSNEGKAVVGIAKVSKEHYQDPSTDEDWSSVEIAPVKKVVEEVDLAKLKSTKALANMALVKKSRISVTPVTDAELAVVLSLAKTTL